MSLNESLNNALDNLNTYIKEDNQSLASLDQNTRDLLDIEVTTLLDILNKYTKDVTKREAKVNIKIDGTFIFDGEADSDEAMDQKEEAFNNIVNDLKANGYRDFGGKAVFDRDLIPFNNRVGNAFFSLTKRYEGMRINIRFEAFSRAEDYFIDMRVKF